MSSPVNRAPIGAWSGKVLVTFKVPPAAAIRLAASSHSPRGRAIHFGSGASKQQIRRGVLKVENRWFWRR